MAEGVGKDLISCFKSLIKRTVWRLKLKMESRHPLIINQATYSAEDLRSETDLYHQQQVTFSSLLGSSQTSSCFCIKRCLCYKCVNNAVKTSRYHIMTGDVEEILEVLVPRAEQGPHRAGAFVDVSRLPLVSVVTQKGAVKTRVRMLHQLDLDTFRKQNRKSSFSQHASTESPF